MSEAKADAGQVFCKAATRQSACVYNLQKAARHASQILQIGIELLLCFAAPTCQNSGIAAYKEGWTKCSGKRILIGKHMQG